MRDPNKFIPWTNLFYDTGLFFNLSATHHLPRLLARLARIFLFVRSGDISAVQSSGENRGAQTTRRRNRWKSESLKSSVKPTKNADCELQQNRARFGYAHSAALTVE